MTQEELHAYAQRYIGVLLTDKQARDHLAQHGHVSLLNNVLQPETPLTQADADAIKAHGAQHLQEFCTAVKGAAAGEADEVLETYMDGFNTYPPRH